LHAICEPRMFGII